MLVSGSDEHNLIHWTNNKVNLIQNIKPCFTNSMVQINSELIAVGGKGIVWLIDIKECRLAKKIVMEEISYINCLMTYKENLFCGAYPGKIVYIDLKQNNEYKILSSNEMTPYIDAMVYIDNDTFIEGSVIKNMNVWSIS